MNKLMREWQKNLQNSKMTRRITEEEIEREMGCGGILIAGRGHGA
jgi:hypothetical protein